MSLGVNLLNPKAWKTMPFPGLFFSVSIFPPMASIIFAAGKMAATLKARPAISRAIDWVLGTVFAVFAVRILMAEGR